MPRLRTLKPGFFENEELAQIEPLGRLLFCGLWCIADRRGRLEDRPARIKVQLLGYDTCDVNELLDSLAAHGFIVRYEVEERSYIQVVNFEKHQNPHLKEAESTIPAPGQHQASTSKEGASTVPAPGQHDASTVLSVRSLGSSYLDPTIGNRGGTRARAREAPPTKGKTGTPKSGSDETSSELTTLAD